MKPQQHGSRFAAKIVPAEWNCDPRLTTPNQIQHALEDGKGLPGNLVISLSDDTLEVLQNLIAAFDVHDALTLAEVAPAASSEPACAVWRHGASSPDSKPQRLKLRCSQLTVVSGPEPRPPTTVTFRPKPKVEMSTLRVLAPTQYRQLFIDADTWDSPTTIIAELAKKLGKPATTFTGGTWQNVTTTKGSTLQGHIRVPVAIANLATQQSGFRGIFTMIASKSSSSSGVAWVKRNEGSFEEYFRTVHSVAEDQGKPLAIRQHGLSDLGIVGGEVTWDSPNKPKAFVMHGAPHA